MRGPAYWEKRIAIGMKKGTPVVLKWTAWPDGKPDPDPTTGASLATNDSQPIEKSKAFRGFWDEVQPSQSSYRAHAEIQTGDGILDLPSSIVIDGLEGAYFLINGEKWVQKQIGTSLAKSWEATYGPRKLLRRVLLRKAT